MGCVVLELAILGLLKEQELHGYELKKRLSDTLGFASGVSFGSLYPALARLEAAGAVKAVEAKSAPVAAIPLTGSLGGELAAFRARKAVARGQPGQEGLRHHESWPGVCSRSCWPPRASPATTTAFSTCGWPSPATCRPTPASGCSSGAGLSWWSGWSR